MSLLLRSPALRAIESEALAAGAPLMARAGLAATQVAHAMLSGATRQPARVLPENVACKRRKPRRTSQPNGADGSE